MRLTGYQPKPATAGLGKPPITQKKGSKMEKFIITLECTNPRTLADLIAGGLEKHAKVIGIEAVNVPTAVINPEAQPEPAKNHKEETSHKRKIKSFELYKFATELYHPQKTFTSSDLRAQWIRYGRDGTPSSVSAHLHRMANSGLVERVDGDTNNGYIYCLRRVVGARKFHEMMREANSPKKSSPAHILSRHFGGRA